LCVSNIKEFAPIEPKTKRVQKDHCLDGSPSTATFQTFKREPVTYTLTFHTYSCTLACQLTNVPFDLVVIPPRGMLVDAQ